MKALLSGRTSSPFQAGVSGWPVSSSSVLWFFSSEMRGARWGGTTRFAIARHSPFYSLFLPHFLPLSNTDEANILPPICSIPSSAENDTRARFRPQGSRERAERRRRRHDDDDDGESARFARRECTRTRNRSRSEPTEGLRSGSSRGIAGRAIFGITDFSREGPSRCSPPVYLSCFIFITTEVPPVLHGNCYRKYFIPNLVWPSDFLIGNAYLLARFYSVWFLPLSFSSFLARSREQAGLWKKIYVTKVSVRGIQGHDGRSKSRSTDKENDADDGDFVGRLSFSCRDVFALTANISRTIRLLAGRVIEETPS